MLVATSLETHTKVNLVTLGSHAWWGGDLRPLKLEEKKHAKKKIESHNVTNFVPYYALPVNKC